MYLYQTKHIVITSKSCYLVQVAMELWQMKKKKNHTLPLLAAVPFHFEFQTVPKNKRQLCYDTHEYLLHDSQC